MFADVAFQLAAIRAYNEFISDWVADCPERLGAIWQIPSAGVDACTADWPHSRYLINSMSQGIDAEKKHKLFCANAGRLYGFIE